MPLLTWLPPTPLQLPTWIKYLGHRVRSVSWPKVLVIFFKPHVSILKITTKSVCGYRIFFFVSTTFFTTCPMRRISVKTNSMATMVPCNLVAILLKVKSGGEFQMHIACPHSTKTWRFSNVFISDVDFVDVTRARVTNADVVWAVQTFKLNQWICTKMGWYIKYKMCP